MNGQLCLPIRIIDADLHEAFRVGRLDLQLYAIYLAEGASGSG